MSDVYEATKKYGIQFIFCNDHKVVEVAKGGMEIMIFPDRKIVEQVKNEYPAGTKGTVVGVDDTASIMVRWDNGSRLNVVYGEDSCKKIG